MQALQLVSRDKLTDFLVGEYPWMSKVVHEIERIGTSSLAPSDLRMVSHDAQAMPVEALQDFLCDIGLLKPVGHRVPSRATSFEVAPLYCPGLGLNLLSDCVE